MSIWLQAATWYFLRFLAWVFLPGLALGWAAGLQVSRSLLVAPALSVGTLAVFAILLGELGVPWAPLTVAISVALLALAVFGVRLAANRWRRIPNSQPAASDLIYCGLGVTFAAVLTAIPLVRGISNPNYFPQSWDSVYHLNAARFILDSGNASSFWINNMINASDAFYPSAWHGLVALISTGDVVIPSNVMAIGTASLILPLGLTAAARQIAPQYPFAWLLAPLVGTLFFSFPTQYLAYGVLWPNAFAYALMPMVVALTLMATAARDNNRAGIIFLALVAAAGTALAHPNALVIYAIVVTPIIVCRAIKLIRRSIRTWDKSAPRNWRLLAPAGLSALLLAGWFVGWFVVGKVFIRHLGLASDPDQGFWNGVWAAVADGNAYNAEPRFGIAVTVLAAAIFLLARRKFAWLIIPLAAIAGIVGLTFAPQSPLGFIAAIWWTSGMRVQGGFTILATLVVAIALAEAAQMIGTGARADWEARALSRGRSAGNFNFATILALAVALAIVGISISQAPARQATVAGTYRGSLSPDSPWHLASQDEIVMLQELSEVIPDDGLIVGSPWNGTALAYSFGGIPVVFPHFSGRYTADQQLLKDSFNAIHENPEVCAAINRLGVRYFYTDPNTYQHGHPWQEPWAALQIDAPQPGFELVATGGTARVYRITACD